MAKKKEFKPIQFTAKVDGKNKKLEIFKPTVIVPGYGKFRADQLTEENTRSQEALAILVSRKSGVLREVVEDNPKKGGK